MLDKKKEVEDYVRETYNMEPDWDSEIYVEKIVGAMGRGEDFVFASPRLQNNKKFVMSLLEETPSVYRYLPLKYRNNKKITLSLLKSPYCSINLEDVGPKCIENRAIVLQLVKNEPTNILKIDSKFSENKKFLLDAVNSRRHFFEGEFYHVFDYIAPQFQEDKKIRQIAAMNGVEMTDSEDERTTGKDKREMEESKYNINTEKPEDKMPKITRIQKLQEALKNKKEILSVIKEHIREAKSQIKELATPQHERANNQDIDND